MQYIIQNNIYLTFARAKHVSKIAPQKMNGFLAPKVMSKVNPQKITKI